MEYEIADRPLLAEGDRCGLVETGRPIRLEPSRPRFPQREQRDRAVAIPEQEQGS